MKFEENLFFNEIWRNSSLKRWNLKKLFFAEEALLCKDEIWRNSSTLFCRDEEELWRDELENHASLKKWNFEETLLSKINLKKPVCHEMKFEESLPWRNEIWRNSSLKKRNEIWKFFPAKMKITQTLLCRHKDEESRFCRDEIWRTSSLQTWNLRTSVLQTWNLKKLFSAEMKFEESRLWRKKIEETPLRPPRGVVGLKKYAKPEKRRRIDVAHVMFQCQMQFVVLLPSRIKAFMDKTFTGSNSIFVHFSPHRDSAILG